MASMDAHVSILGGSASILILASFLCSAAAQQYLYEFDDYTNHPCNRPCEDNAQPRVCKYRWLLEDYYTLSKACYDCPFNQSHCYLPHCVPTDGVSRGIKTTNRKLPGPSVVVCQGDTIEVRVTNKMEAGEATSIHWHGILQHGSPHMDGIGMITQCPITSQTTFTYKFVAENPGTHFWHAHSGVQRSDGLFGALIVRQPPGLEAHDTLYDHDLSEHVVIVTDWLNEMSINRFSAHHHDDGDNKPALMLINGKGRHEEFTDDQGVSHYTPYEVFTVEGGKRYRFRVISSAIMNCPIQVSIDQHTMMVIASDGNSFEPFVADSFNIFAGERYDFILIADKTDSLRSYWFRFRGLADCSNKPANQVAVVRYEGAGDALPPEPTEWSDGIRGGILLNPWNHKGDSTNVEVSRMLSEAPDDDALLSEPDQKIYLAMDFNKIDNNRFHHPDFYPLQSVARNKHIYSPQINHISSLLPPSPLLTQYDHVSQDRFCNANTVQHDCESEWCACIHKYDFNLGEIVEVVLIDEGVTFDANHPMHLHGFKFRVIGLDRINKSTSLEEVKEMDARGELPRTLSRAPLKDTVTVPDGGYTIIRFKADNPGVWLFHCHIEFHAEIGMGVIFRVGNSSQIPKPPRRFPVCGDFDPNYDDDDDDDGHHGNDDDGGQGNQNGDNSDPQTIKVEVTCVAGNNAQGQGQGSNAAESTVPFSRWLLLLFTAIGTVFIHSM